MIEVVGNLWEYPADVRIITTNGSINRKGEAVMGRGCALEAKTLFPELPKQLAAKLKAEGNHPYNFDFVRTIWLQDGPTATPEVLERIGWKIITFPVKHQWFELADYNLIRTSVLQLKLMLDPKLTYVMPRPGCGNGGRDWRDVKHLLKDLPDNVHVITFGDKIDPKAAEL